MKHLDATFSFHLEGVLSCDQIGELVGAPSPDYAKIKFECQRSLVAQPDSPTDAAQLLLWCAEAMVKVEPRHMVGVPWYMDRAIELVKRSLRPDHLLLVRLKCLLLTSTAEIYTHQQFLEQITALRREVNGYTKVSREHARKIEELLVDLETQSRTFAAGNVFMNY